MRSTSVLTARVQNDLALRARLAASDTGRTVSQLIADLLSAALGRAESQVARGQR